MPKRDHLHKIQPAVQAILGRGQEAVEHSSELTGRARRACQVVTPLGRIVVGVGVLAWIGGWWLGWHELMVLAGVCLVLLVVTGLFVIGRAALRVEVELNPCRVVAGEPSDGQVHVSNRSSRRMTPLQVVLPVGSGVAVFDVPSLGPGKAVEELFVVPTERRGVIPVGPATSFRGDPLGLFHRQAPGSEAHELIVHPHTVALEPFGSGLFRDLEGLTTKDLSASDLAFYGLRQYTPGDDRRHVHWRSSAKVGQLQVRQFLDTRRSNLCVVVDGQTASYGDPEEFETALQVAGSVALRACRDELPATIVAGEHAASGVVPHLLLDALSRAELRRNAPDPATLVSRAVIRGGDISFALLVSGSQIAPKELQRAAVRFPIEVRVLAIRVVPGEPPGISAGGPATLAQLGVLADLPRLLRREVVV
jgi:uncharacterized protein (DUF58 family)